MNNELPSQSQIQKVTIMPTNDKEFDDFMTQISSLGRVICRIQVKEGYVCLIEYKKEPDPEFFDRIVD